jgi:hypothetical protein
MQKPSSPPVGYRVLSDSDPKLNEEIHTHLDNLKEARKGIDNYATYGGGRSAPSSLYDKLYEHYKALKVIGFQTPEEKSLVENIVGIGTFSQFESRYDLEHQAGPSKKWGPQL